PAHVRDTTCCGGHTRPCVPHRATRTQLDSFVATRGSQCNSAWRRSVRAPCRRWKALRTVPVLCWLGRLRDGRPGNSGRMVGSERYQLSETLDRRLEHFRYARSDRRGDARPYLKERLAVAAHRCWSGLRRDAEPAVGVRSDRARTLLPYCAR